jgi:hypothetical protein
MSVDAHDAAARLPAPAQVRERQVLILDLSKSMLAPLPDSGGPGAEKQKIEVARTAVYRILENAETNSAFFGLVTFTETVRVAVPLTEIRRENLPYIESLISMLTPSGRSAIWDAIAVGADLLRTAHGVDGNLVLVTDGWDNASTRFTVTDPGQTSAQPNLSELAPYLLPPGSNLTLKVIGIGSGSERDKGVDSSRMGRFLDGLSRRATELQVPTTFTYQEVVTGSQLFSQMVNAFLDVDFEGARGGIDQLHPEELARHAANAAKALKQPQQHATVGRLTGHLASPAASAEIYDEAPSLEVDVLSTPNGAVPANLKERYGPLGGVIEAYLSRDYTGAMERLQRSAAMLPPVTVHYWEARIHFAKNEIVEAARTLLQAWGESDKLPPTNRGRVIRRLALLQAKLQNDKETETLIQFIDETENKLSHADPKLKARLTELFQALMELRGTYQLTQLGGTEDGSDAAAKHEVAVEHVFGMLQDARLENTSGEAVVDGALDFVEICLAEMR